MLNRMNKHMGQTFNLRTLLGIESKEHGKKETPQQLIRSEQKEHKLGKKPTLRQAMEAEFAEHDNGQGEAIMKPGATQRAKATEVYRRK